MQYEIKSTFTVKSIVRDRDGVDKIEYDRQDKDFEMILIRLYKFLKRTKKMCQLADNNLSWQLEDDLLLFCRSDSVPVFSKIVKILSHTIINIKEEIDGKFLYESKNSQFIDKAYKAFLVKGTCLPCLDDILLYEKPSAE